MKDLTCLTDEGCFLLVDPKQKVFLDNLEKHQIIGNIHTVYIVMDVKEKETQGVFLHKVAAETQRDSLNKTGWCCEIFEDVFMADLKDI